MAEWDYAYTAGPPGGPYVALSDYTESFRVISEGMSGKRGSNPQIPYRDGEYSVPRKFLTGKIVLFDAVIKYTNPSGIVTHTDGDAGHAYENLSSLFQLLGWGNNSEAMIRRTAPHFGAIEARFETLTPIEAAGPRTRFVFPMRSLDGVWREQALSTDTQASVSSFPLVFNIATGGNYEIGDAIFTLTCVAAGSSLSISIGSGDTITIPGAFVINDVIVVNLENNTYTLNGVRYPPITTNRPWWIRMFPATATFPITLNAASGTWTLKTDWRNKWL